MGETTAVVAPVIAGKGRAEAASRSTPRKPQPRLAVLRAIGRMIKQAALDFGGLTSVLAFAIWVAGVTVGSILAITILGVFALIAIARVFRAVADIDRFTVAIVADDSISGVYRRAAPGSGWFTRLFTVLGDPQTWRDLPWLVLRSVLGLAFGVAAVTLVRVVICEDLALLREGLVGLLERDGFEVVAPVGDAESFEHEVEARSPDVCVVDLRLPPAFTDEGLRAAIAIRVSPC